MFTSVCVELAQCLIAPPSKIIFPALPTPVEPSAANDNGANVPLLIVEPPKVFVAPKVNTPIPSLVMAPVPIEIGSLTVTLPAPPNVIFEEPVIAFPLATSKVNVPTSELILNAEDCVIAPPYVLLPKIFLIEPAPPTPVPLIVNASAPIIIPPDNCNATPSAIVTPPATVPKAVLLAAVTTPAEIVVRPV